MKIRVSMLNSLVRSRLTYGCQTWNCNTDQTNKLNSTYMGYIRRMVKGGFNRREESWRFQYTNNDLLRISNTPGICTFVRNQQSIYVKKILLKNNNQIVKRLLLNDDVSRKPGRQTTLLRSVLQSRNCNLKDLMAIDDD